MVIVQVCVGSSCHLRGSHDIVELLEKEVKDAHLEEEVILVGSFCLGKCNRIGVTVTVDDDVYTGVTRETFRDFWRDHILPRVKQEG